MDSAQLPFFRRLVLVSLIILSGCAAVPDGSSKPQVPDRSATDSSQLLRFDAGQLELQAQAGLCRLRWRGELQSDAVQSLGEALRALETRSCTRKTLALDLQGGDIGPAATLGSMLKNRQFDTELLANSHCHTPCMMVFAAGRQRQVPDASQAARLLLTQPRPDQDFGQTTCATELSLGQQLLLTRYLRAMLPLSTATALYQKIGQATCRSHDTLGATEALALGLATGTLAPGLR